MAVAMAVVAAAQERKLQLVEVTDFDSPVGKGVLGKVDGVAVVSGAAKFLAEQGIDVGSLQGAAERQRAQAATVIFVALGGRLAGHSMFQGAALERLKMCGDCRVIDLHTATNETRITDL